MPSTRPLLVGPLLAAAWLVSCSEYDSSLLRYADASIDGPSKDAPDDVDASLDSAPDEADAPVDQEADALDEDAPDDAPEDAPEDVHEDVDPRACDQCKDLSLARPPCEHPGTDPAPLADPLVFAVRTIRASALPTDDIGEWKSIGYDLDCLFTSTDATPSSCLPTSTSTTLTEDGLEGRDSSFARNLSGQIRLLIGFGVFPNVQGQAVSRLEAGEWGWLFVVDQYGGGDDDPQVRVAVYHSPGTVNSGGSPIQASWDGLDRWALEADSVDSFGSPVHVDDAAFVVGGTVVARLPGTLPLSLRADSVRLDVPVQQVLVTLKLSPDRQSVEQGVFVGAARATAALTAFDDLAAQAGVCLPNELYSDARNVIANAADLRQDPPQDPNSYCDSMSVGLEFSAQKAVLGPVKPSQPMVVPPCPDAGL